LRHGEGEQTGEDGPETGQAGVLTRDEGSALPPFIILVPVMELLQPVPDRVGHEIPLYKFFRLYIIIA